MTLSILSLPWDTFLHTPFLMHFEAFNALLFFRLMVFFGVFSGVQMVFGHVLRGVWFSAVDK